MTYSLVFIMSIYMVPLDGVRRNLARSAGVISRILGFWCSALNELLCGDRYRAVLYVGCLIGIFVGPF